jgi:hypothetical protein
MAKKLADMGNLKRLVCYLGTADRQKQWQPFYYFDVAYPDPIFLIRLFILHLSL